MRPVTANATITVPKRQRPYHPDSELLSSSGFNGTISAINKPGNPSSITSSLSEVVIPMNISTSHSSQDQQEQNNPTPHLHPSLSGKYAFNRKFMGKHYAGKNRGENNDKNIIDHNGSDEETMNGFVRSSSANSFLKKGYMMNTITSRQRKKERTIDKISSIDSMNDLSVDSSNSREDRLSSPFSQNFASNLLDQGALKKPKSKSNDTNSMRTSGIPIIRSVDSVSYREQDQIELGGAFMDPHSQQITHEQKKELEEVVDANTEMIDQLFSLSKQKGNDNSFSNSSSVLSSSSLSSMNERQKHRMKTLFTISTQQQQLQQSESSHYQRHLQRNSSLIHHRKQVEDTYDYKPFQRDRTKFQRITDLPTLQVRLVVDRVQGLYNFHQQVKHRERMLAYPCVSPEEKDNVVEAARHLNEPFLNFLYDNLNISSFEEEEDDEIEEHKEVLTEQNQLGS